MKRNFVREYTYEAKGKVAEKKKIGVLSMGGGSGGTLISLALAQELSERGKSVAFIELSEGKVGKALTYDALDMNARFAKKEYKNVYGEVENNRRINERENWEAGINWTLITPDENMRSINLSKVQEGILCSNTVGDYYICDMGSTFKEARVAFMDIVICVVDPMPSKIIANHHIYTSLLQSQCSVVWMINKDNPGIHKKTLFQYIKIRKHMSVPLIDGAWTYMAEYKCRLPYEQKQIKEALQPIMAEIVQRYIEATNS